MPRAAVAVAQHDRPLWHRSVSSAHLYRFHDPFRTTAGESAAVEAIAHGPIRSGPKKIEFRIFGRQDEPCASQARQVRGQLAKGKERQRSAREVIRLPGRSQGRTISTTRPAQVLGTILIAVRRSRD